MSARNDVLDRIRAANRTGLRTGADDGGSADVVVPRDYRSLGSHAAGSEELLDLLEDRLVDYHATVHRATAVTVGDVVAAAVRSAVTDGGRVVVPPRIPDAWVAGLGDVVSDVGLSTAAELDGFAAVVTASAVACAETGTIVLDGSPDQGRRAITLVPDVHVCVVLASQVVHTVPEMVGRLNPAKALTFISGPSATSDIELNRVEGVHGPRNLHVVLVTGPTA